MQPNPFKALVHSRKFWLAMLDIAGFVGGTLATRYLSPADVQMVMALGVACQPAIVMVIGAIAYEDGKAMQAGKLP